MQELPLSQVNDFFENHLEPLVGELRPGMQPLWGQMSPQHAIEHLSFTLKGAAGVIQVPIHTPEDKLPRVRMFLLNNVLILPNFKSPILDPDTLPPLKNIGLAEAIAEFWTDWANFIAFFKANPGATTAHAVFGMLNEEEWRRFHFKHFVHHLSQFGVTTQGAHGLVPPPPKN